MPPSAAAPTAPAATARACPAPPRAGPNYSLASSYQQSRGFDATNGKNFLHNPDRDSYYENNVAGSLGDEWMRGQTPTAQFYQTHLNGGYDNDAPYFNDRSIQDLQGHSADQHEPG